VNSGCQERQKQEITKEEIGKERNAKKQYGHSGVE
jgi:hypothetical protein